MVQAIDDILGEIFRINLKNNKKSVLRNDENAPIRVISQSFCISEDISSMVATKGRKCILVQILTSNIFEHFSRPQVTVHEPQQRESKTIQPCLYTFFGVKDLLLQANVGDDRIFCIERGMFP